ncbi:MAG: tetratricopeptide repeat protein [Bacteroidota bacterium]
MAKKYNRPAQQPAAAPRPAQAAVAAQPEPQQDYRFPAWLYDFKVQAIIVGLLSFLFYCNTYKNEYALDDTIVIVKNEYVHQGFAGIKDILTKDAFDSYYKQFNSQNQLSGGRYRPLSIITFAIEQQLFGAISKTDVDSFITYGISFDMHTPAEKKFLNQMHIRHMVNVLLFTLSVIALLYFLRYVVFRNNHIVALIATILFAIHPVHTEVIANVKSRDEIMSLLFICLTFIHAFRYQELGDKKNLIYSLVFYLLAFLSKEYAIAMMILLPLSFILFNRSAFSTAVKNTLPYIGVVAVYALLRLQVVQPMSAASDADILNNPYAYATEVEKLATRIATSLNYFRLLIFPHPLTADYSYNTIPYKDFSNIIVWISLAIHAFMVWLMFALFRKFMATEEPRVAIPDTTRYTIIGITMRRETLAIICFGLAFFLSHLLLINNFIFNIGATMGERLIYHSSVGFCIIAAYLLYKGIEKIGSVSTGNAALVAVMVIGIGLCGYKVLGRNADWQNDETLFNHDIGISPNSVLVNANVASSLINMAETEKDEAKKKEDLRKGIAYYDKAMSIHKSFVSGFMNRGVAYMKLGMPDSAKANYDQVKALYPNYPKLYEIYYNLGVCYYFNKMVPQAISVWQTVTKMQPDYVLAQQSINTAMKEVAGQQQAPPPQAPQQAPPPKQ